MRAASNKGCAIEAWVPTPMRRIGRKAEPGRRRAGGDEAPTILESGWCDALAGSRPGVVIAG